MTDKEKIDMLIDADNKAYNKIKSDFIQYVPDRLKKWLEEIRKESGVTK